MYGKALFFVVLVVVGAVLPYILADDQWLSKIENWLASNPQASEVIADDSAPTKPTTAGKPIPIHGSKKPILPSVATLRPDGRETNMANSAANSGYSGSLPVGLYGNAGGASMAPGIGNVSAATAGRPIESRTVIGPPSIPIEHLLSFGVTPEWIQKNWTRVSTRLSELELQGWRVPISLEDAYSLIGSVTYYFDRQQQVQRILLHGYTPDPAELIRLAESRYWMQRIPNAVQGLYVHAIDGVPVGGLQLKEAPVLKSGARRTGVLMELNRLGSPYGMSLEFEEILRKLKQEDLSMRPIEELDLEELRMSPIDRTYQFPADNTGQRDPRLNAYPTNSVPSATPQQNRLWSPNSNLQRSVPQPGQPGYRNDLNALQANPTVNPAALESQRRRNPFFRFPN